MSRYTPREIVDKLPLAIAIMLNAKDEGGCTYWYLQGDIDPENNWAIVIGWQDGYEPDPANPFKDGEYQLCIKLAYQSRLSIMQCDFDVDWLMPMDENGEVDDTCEALDEHFDYKHEVDHLYERFMHYMHAIAEAEMVKGG